YQRHHLALPLRQQIEVGDGRRPSRPGCELLDQPARDARREQSIATRHRPYCLHELGRIGVLDQEAARPDAQGLEDVLVEVEGSEDDDAHAGQAVVGGDRARRLQAVRTRHANVHEEHVGALAAGDPDGFVAVAGLTDHLDVVLGVEQGAEAGAHERLVIRHGDTDHDGASSGSRAWTAKPPPACGPASRRPPRAAARSRMPAMPVPAPDALDWLAPPRPSSTTSTVRTPSSWVMQTLADWALAWRVTLVSASCTMR